MILRLRNWSTLQLVHTADKDNSFVSSVSAVWTSYYTQNLKGSVQTKLLMHCLLLLLLLLTFSVSTNNRQYFTKHCVNNTQFKFLAQLKITEGQRYNLMTLERS